MPECDGEEEDELCVSKGGEGTLQVEKALVCSQEAWARIGGEAQAVRVPA